MAKELLVYKNGILLISFYGSSNPVSEYLGDCANSNGILTHLTKEDVDFASQKCNQDELALAADIQKQKEYLGYVPDAETYYNAIETLEDLRKQYEQLHDTGVKLRMIYVMIDESELDDNQESYWTVQWSY